MARLRRLRRNQGKARQDALFCDECSEVCDSACRAAEQRDATMRAIVRMGGYSRVV
jgi:hypothetical protein